MFDAADLPANPYHPEVDGDYQNAPFVGRQDAFLRLHQHLIDGTVTGATVFLGRRHIGKTALLQRFNHVFDETFIGVLIPMEYALLRSEADWLLTVADAMTLVMAHRGFTFTRLPEPPQEDEKIREWLVDQFLPETFMTIRPHRRLVLLFDDADELAEAVAHEKLPDDTFTFLHELLQKYPQLGMGMTIGADREPHIHTMQPLVTPARVLRLRTLPQEDAVELLQQPPRSYYTLNESSAVTAYRATGGQPLLLQRFGYQLFQRWQYNSSLNVFTSEDVRAVTAAVYNESEDELRTNWEEMARSERLVVTAISDLTYKDPLAAVSVGDIAGWMLETDYSLDRTAIHAALRALEYREVVVNTEDGVQMAAGLMQTWLLENARHGDGLAMASNDEDGDPPPDRTRRLSWLVIVILVVLFVGALLLVVITSTPQTDPSFEPQPTVTLLGSDGDS